MTQNENHLPIFFHLKWVAKIALSVGALAIVGLLLELFLITDGKGTEYVRIIQAHHLTREHLGPAILVFGLTMTLIASLITWLISLYGSFRIAGPLYRFAQNMKNASAHPSAMRVAIRHTDLLQDEWREFEASLARLDTHYRDLRTALVQARQALPPDAGSDPAAVRLAMRPLIEVEHRVRL